MAERRAMNRGGNYVAALGLGLTIGALTALMFAPKRGEELRHDIKDKTDNARERARETWERMRERFQATAEEAKGKAKRAKSEAETYAEEF